MDIADQADIQQQKILDAEIASIEQYGIWNGKPRECKGCLADIPKGRLKACNAFLCIECKTDEEGS